MSMHSAPRSVFFHTVNLASRAHLPSLLAAWLPDGRLRGQ